VTETHDQHADAEEPRNDDSDDRDERDGGSPLDELIEGVVGDRLRLGSATDVVLAALVEAGPEAVDHLLKAAQELLLAAKAVVDAGERAVESHRSGADPEARGEEPPDGNARVRRIDLA
jgi:hypothetical protein